MPSHQVALQSVAATIHWPAVLDTQLNAGQGCGLLAGTGQDSGENLLLELRKCRKIL